MFLGRRDYGFEAMNTRRLAMDAGGRDFVRAVRRCVSAGPGDRRRTRLAQARGLAQVGAGESTVDRADRVKKIHDYIARGWDSLTRTMESCAVVADPKMPRGSSVLYVPVDFSGAGATGGRTGEAAGAVRRARRKIAEGD